MNTTFEEIRGNFQTAMRKNPNLKKGNANLCLKCDAIEEELKKCQERLTYCEQYSRNGNIEIKGVEKRNQENLYDMLDKLGVRSASRSRVLISPHVIAYQLETPKRPTSLCSL